MRLNLILHVVAAMGLYILSRYIVLKFLGLVEGVATVTMKAVSYCLPLLIYSSKACRYGIPRTA